MQEVLDPRADPMQCMLSAVVLYAQIPFTIRHLVDGLEAWTRDFLASTPKHALEQAAFILLTIGSIHNELKQFAVHDTFKGFELVAPVLESRGAEFTTYYFKEASARIQCSVDGVSEAMEKRICARISTLIAAQLDCVFKIRDKLYARYHDLLASDSYENRGSFASTVELFLGALSGVQMLSPREMLAQCWFTPEMMILRKTKRRPLAPPPGLPCIL